MSLTWREEEDKKQYQSLSHNPLKLKEHLPFLYTNRKMKKKRIKGDCHNKFERLLVLIA